MTSREAIRMIEADGWFRVPPTGGHPQFEPPTQPGRVTVPGKPGKELALGAVNSIKPA